jgi:hypothetical protein
MTMGRGAHYGVVGLLDQRQPSALVPEGTWPDGSGPVPSRVMRTATAVPGHPDRSPLLPFCLVPPEGSPALVPSHALLCRGVCDQGVISDGVGSRRWRSCLDEPVEVGKGGVAGANPFLAHTRARRAWGLTLQPAAADYRPAPVPVGVVWLTSGPASSGAPRELPAWATAIDPVRSTPHCAKRAPDPWIPGSSPD